MNKKITLLLLTIFLAPVIVFGQSKMEKISLLNNKIEISVPKELSTMTDEIWKLKYQNKPKSTLALSDKNGEINLIGDMTQQPASESQLTAYKDFQINSLKKKRSDLEILAQGIKTVNGKKVGYFKFISDAVDQKVFNYYFFTIVSGKILIFSFNCIEKLRNEWGKTADEIVASLNVK